MDASALLRLFIAEARTDQAHESLRGNALIISDFAIAEFSSGVARRKKCESEIAAMSDTASLVFRVRPATDPSKSDMSHRDPEVTCAQSADQALSRLAKKLYPIFLSICRRPKPVAYS